MGIKYLLKQVKRLTSSGKTSSVSIKAEDILFLYPHKVVLVGGRFFIFQHEQRTEHHDKIKALKENKQEIHLSVSGVTVRRIE